MTIAKPSIPGQSKDMVVFWGSQSGTAECFANRLAREIHLRFDKEALAADLSDYDTETISQIPATKLVIFIISTYGEGDPSDNAAGLWEWINSSNRSVQNLRYVALGLGNKNYKYFNRVVNVVSEALDNAGAARLLPVGRADDSNGSTEEDFMAWRDFLFAFFRTGLGFEEKEMAYEPTLAVVDDESMTPIDLHAGEPSRLYKSRLAINSPIRAVPVISSRELFINSSRNCLHLEFDLHQFPELKYKTGDHLAVWPANPDTEVTRLLHVLGLTNKKDMPLLITSLDPSIKTKIPSPTTLDTIFYYYLEICAPVSRDAISALVQFAPTPSAKKFLSNLGADKSTYHSFQSQHILNFGRLLELTPTEGHNWSSLPLPFLLETLPTLQPRYYSISSSSVASPRQPSITAAVTATPLPQNPTAILHGLTTNYLLSLTHSLHVSTPPPPSTPTYPLTGPNNLLIGGKLHIHLRKSKFKLPILSSRPLIMVAAGTGIAPFLGFLQERNRLNSMGRATGPMLLFFGCRNSTTDYLYRSELHSLQESLGGEPHLQIITAFSREESTLSGGRMYVQEKIKQHAEKVCTMLEDGGSNFYICGSASMAREVAKVVGEEMAKVHEWDETSLRAWSEGEKRVGRWQEDVWG
jgi:NADPH-ferrihemoprotein reductase